jgi:hypothetical protein
MPEKYSTGDSLNAMSQKRKIVTAITPQVGITEYSEGCVRKIYAFIDEIYKQCGRIEKIEAYWLPLRRPDETIIRDIFVPKQYLGQHIYIEVVAHAFWEVSNLNYEMIVDGWNHLHPGFGTGPSDTDRDNNHDVLKTVTHNTLEGYLKTLLRGMNAETRDDEILLSHVLENKSVAIQVSDLAKMINAYAIKNGMPQATLEEAHEFIKGYIAAGHAFINMAYYEKAPLMYIKSTVWNGLNLENVIRLDGTQAGGITSEVTSEVLFKKYDPVRKIWSEPEFPKRVPMKVTKLADDTKFTPKEIQELVRSQIYLPRQDYKRRQEEEMRRQKEAEEAEKKIKETPIVASVEITAATPTSEAKPLVVDKEESQLYLLVQSVIYWIFHGGKKKQ